MHRRLFAPVVLSFAALSFGCRAELTKPPEVPSDDEEALVGTSTYEEDGLSEEETLDEQFGKRAELPPKKDPKEVCKGKGKKRTCEMKDPTPDVTAAYGARKLTKGYRWGMSPTQVLDSLSRDIEEEYQDKQSKAASAVEQDRNREWKRARIDELAQNRVKFETRANHKWGVSLIQFDYEDDNGEEMVWIKSNANLKKFYFFKDGELWKIVYAYSTSAYKEGDDHKAVVDAHFKKFFGVSPENKVKQDPETMAPILRYLEWATKDGDLIRAFDQTQVHGVHVVAVVSGDAEKYIGERLPNTTKDAAFEEDVGDVLGGTDVCYDEAGELIDDPDKCKELMGLDEEG